MGTARLDEPGVRVSSLAVIPARGGSKGLERKCAQPVAGVPLLVRAVRVARGARTVARVILSTDDRGFADMARAEGAEVPFLRPAHLATDTSPITATVRHLCEHLLQAEGRMPDFLLLLQPTSPLVRAVDVDRAFRLFTRETDAVVSVCESEVLPDWLRNLTSAGWLTPLPCGLDAPQHTDRQHLPDVYRLNGAIYWVRTEAFMRDNTLIPKASRPYIMSGQRSIDVDTLFDLKLADWLAERLESETTDPDYC